MASSSQPGGFLHPLLPSSPPSTINSPTASTPHSTLLPQPRSKPLRPGSPKETTFINYIETKLLAISRRYENRFSASLGDEENPDVEGRGYKGIEEEVRDLESCVEGVWVSGTPQLQITFLLTIALMVMESLPSFPFAPRPTFGLLRKLDTAFVSLLRGRSVETGEVLPGCEGGRGRVSVTEKVRMRGIVERTRVVVVEVAGKESGGLGDGVRRAMSGTEEEDFNVGGTTTDEEGGDGGVVEDEGSARRWEMDVARVYERTIVELGMALDGNGSGGWVA